MTINEILVFLVVTITTAMAIPTHVADRLRTKDAKFLFRPRQWQNLESLNLLAEEIPK